MKKQFPKDLIIHLFLMGVVVVYIFSFQYLPLQDFPQWIYHGHVFNQILFHHNDFGGFFSFHPYIPPNASATVLIGLFEFIVPPVIAGKIFLLLCIILIYFGSLSVLTTLTKSRSLLFVFISFSACFNLFFYMGYMNFLFGLGIALISCSYVLQYEKSVNSYLMSFLFLLCYCSHFVSLLILFIPVLAVLIYTRDRVFFRKMITSFLPTLGLIIHYYFTKEILTFSSSGIIQTGYLESVWRGIILFPAVEMPFHRIKHVYEPSFFFNSINYAFAILLLIGTLAYVIRIIVKREWSIKTIVGIFTIILVIVSPQYLGGLFNLGERFVPLLWLVLVVYYFRFVKLQSQKIYIFIACILSILSIISLWLSTETFNNMDIIGNVSEFRKFDTHGGSNPFEHFHFYDDILQNKAVPVFHHALLDYPGAENLKPFDQ